MAQDPNDKNSFQANKFLLANGFDEVTKDNSKPKRGVGRPSTDSIKKEAQTLFTESNYVKEDFDRLMN